MDKPTFKMAFKGGVISILITLVGIVPYRYAEGNTDITPYIINGNTASTITYPYMGILIINRLSEPSNSVESFCGGTLVPNSTAKCDTLQYQAANAISLKTIAGCLKSKHFFGR